MRNITLFVFLLGSLCASAQLKYKRIEESDCKIEFARDEFRNTDNFKTISDYYIKSFAKASDGTKLLYTLKKVVGDSYTKIYVLFESNLNECRTSSSYAHLIFSDSSDLKLTTSSNDIDCGAGFLPVILTSEQLVVLSSKQISKVRLQFDDGYKDFTVEKKEQTRFIDNLNCMIKIVKKIKS